MSRLSGGSHVSSSDTFVAAHLNTTSTAAHSLFATKNALSSISLMTSIFRTASRPIRALFHRQKLSASTLEPLRALTVQIATPILSRPAPSGEVMDDETFGMNMDMIFNRISADSSTRSFSLQNRRHRKRTKKRIRFYATLLQKAWVETVSVT